MRSLCTTRPARRGVTPARASSNVAIYVYASAAQSRPSAPQVVERYSKPEVEVRASPELLLAPVAVCRNAHERFLVERSINSVRISLKARQALGHFPRPLACPQGGRSAPAAGRQVRQRDLLEEWLVGKQMTLLMQRADDFHILRRVPVAGYDVSFLITAQVRPPCADRAWAWAAEVLTAVAARSTASALRRRS